MRIFVAFEILLSLLTICTNAAFAEDDSKVHTGRPRSVLIGDYSTKTLALVNKRGQIEWQIPIKNIHDASVLLNGNILLQTDWTDIQEISPDRKVVWKYDAARQNGNSGKRVEVHAFQRLSDGLTMIAESGPARIIEVDLNGQLCHQIALKVEYPNAHTDTRLVRKLANGNYLVAHEGDNKVVREYDPQGKIVWEYATGSKAYSAIRLENGNTLIGMGDGHRVVEVDKSGKTTWAVEANDLPEITLAWVTMVERLPDGNTVIVNCHGGEKNPQIIEIDKSKNIVWTFKDFRRFGNNLPVARVID